MPVYRGEMLKVKGYAKDRREESRLEMEDMINYLTNKLQESNKQKAYILENKKDELAKYEIYEKDISKLTDTEKELIMAEYAGFAASTNITLVKQDSYKDEEIESARSLIKIFKKSPLTEVEDEIAFCNDYISKLRHDFDHNFIIALNKEEITKENIEAIKQYMIKAKEQGLNVQVGIDSAMSLKKNDSGIDYMYNKEQIQLLLDLDKSLKDNELPKLVISELKQIKTIDDFKGSWTLDKVVDANNRIDSIAQHIIDNNFTPFEAMIFIHKWASRFVYNSSDYGLEDSRVLPSILTTNKIVCSGYATLVKALVDKVNIPGLECDLVGCSIIKKNKSGGHCHNLVHIKDDKYDINGFYIEDACWDSRRKDSNYPRGFGHCLYPVEDVMHFAGKVRYFNEDSEDRIDNLLFDSKKFENRLKAFNGNKISNFIRNTVEQLKTKTTPAIVKHYGGKGDAIPIEKYKEAMNAVYSTLNDDKKKIEEVIERDIELSKENAAHTFTSSAKNSFTSTQNKLTKKASGPSARQ